MRQKTMKKLLNFSVVMYRMNGTNATALFCP